MLTFPYPEHQVTNTHINQWLVDTLMIQKSKGYVFIRQKADIKLSAWRLKLTFNEVIWIGGLVLNWKTLPKYIFVLLIRVVFFFQSLFNKSLIPLQHCLFRGRHKVRHIHWTRGYQRMNFPCCFNHMKALQMYSLAPLTGLYNEISRSEH